MPFVDPEEFLGRVMAPCLQNGWSPISPEALILALSMKSWNGQEVICITEILTPKESNGVRVRTPEDWSGRIYGWSWLNPWAAAAGIEKGGRSDHQYRSFTERVLIPRPTATTNKLYPDFPES